ncbi:MAG: DUF1800 family protein [Armatimonadetes bacterium]|nr:DUF1800 family protein [Armatimonadota bacterium]
MNRRDFLRAGVIAGAGSLFAGCSSPVRRYASRGTPDSISPPKADVEPTARLVNRVSFGPVPGELQRVRSMGADAYVDEQLRAGREEDFALRFQLGRLDVHNINAAELRDLPQEEVIRQLQQSALLMSVYSPNQLRERMVDFWTNHFNIYVRKKLSAYRKPTDDISVVRKHALGKYPDLLRASAHSPAMLAFLDNQVNRRGLANENYARELMELHTMGVQGGYTQKDVQEVARCFTGWTIENRFMRPRGTFRFDPERHDNGAKIVLGEKIPAGGGKKDGDTVLDILAQHPSTAKYISGKICRFFLGDGAGAWAGRTAKTYSETGGDIRAMLRPILLAREMLKAPPILKRPFDFMVSSLRALNADTDCGRPLQNHLEDLGQPLYQWPMPDGYPDITDAWTGSLLARWNFALALTAGGMSGTSVDLEKLTAALKAGGATDATSGLAALILSRPVDSHDVNAIGAVLRKESVGDSVDHWKTAALCLASPEFQWH